MIDSTSAVATLWENDEGMWKNESNRTFIKLGSDKFFPKKYFFLGEVFGYYIMQFEYVLYIKFHKYYC